MNGIVAISPDKFEYESCPSRSILFIRSICSELDIWNTCETDFFREFTKLGWMYLQTRSQNTDNRLVLRKDVFAGPQSSFNKVIWLLQKHTKNSITQEIICSKIDQHFAFPRKDHFGYKCFEIDAPGYEKRWPHVLSLLFFATAALSFLPPYILLEIVDFLPHVRTHSPQKKINAIFKLLQSLKMVKGGNALL